MVDPQAHSGEELGMRRLLAIVAPLLGCGGVAEAPPSVGPARTPTVVAPVASGEYPVLVGRSLLGEPTTIALGTNLEAVHGDDSVVFVSQFSSEPTSYLTRVSHDGARASAGKVFALEDEHLVGAARFADGVHYVTARGREVCIRREGPQGLERTGCAPLEGDVLVPSADGFTLVEALNQDESEPKPPKRKPTGRKPKRKRPEEVVVKPAPRKMSLQLTPLSKALVAEEPLTSDLTWKSPMPGMDLIAAARGRNDRIRVAFYELFEGIEKQKRTPVPGSIGRGVVSIASLEADGMIDLSSRHALSTSDLLFGSLATHEAPRFVVSERGILYLDQMSQRGKCATVVATPYYMPMLPDQEACLFNPDRFFDIGTAIREKLPTPPKPTASPRLADARRAYGQTASDPLRVVGFGARKYTRIGDEAFTVENGELARIDPFPLLAKRLRLLHVAWASDGTALAHTDRGLVSIAPGEAPRSLGDVHPRGLGDEERNDVFGSRSFAARIGDAWFQSRGELVSLSAPGKPTIRALPVDAAVLVGGDEVGLVLSLSAERLSVATLDATGVMTAKGSVKSPVLPGFDATARPGGGAIVVGREPGQESFVAFVIDEALRTSAPVRLPPLSAEFTLTPLATGAIASDEKRVAWIDAAGRLVVVKDRPRERGEARCIDGAAPLLSVPSERPGVFVRADTLAQPGTCVFGEAVVRGETLTWLGATVEGASTFAVTGSERLASGPSLVGTPAAPVTMTPLEATTHVRCPPEMVFVPPSLCVDRHEGALVDAKSSRFLSPDLPSTPNLFAIALGDFATKRETMGDLYARAFPMPRVPAWQVGQTLETRVESRAGVRPSAYVTGLVARASCEASRKRLCKLDEWKRACRGQLDRPFPYGTQYVDGVCNVNRSEHPAAILHGHSSLGHLDPRLGRVPSRDGTVLHRTGANRACASAWGDDAVFDMVGNLDEWVDVKGGAFAGGFYARGTRSGCDALVDNHPPSYLDYSTGVRCCRDADP